MNTPFYSIHETSELKLRCIQKVFLMDDKISAVMTIEKLSVYPKIPKLTLYKLTREGNVLSQKVGRHWYFRKEAIDRWLEKT